MTPIASSTPAGGATVAVPLSRGKVALIDAEDLERVLQYVWHAVDRGTNTYAASMALKRDGYYMHRLIAGANRGQHVDHRNGDGLDNRKANLRLCTNAENRRNMRICRGVSAFKGVAFDKRQPGRPWAAYIWFENRKKNLGCYASETEAARAYNAAALQFHGEFASLNVIPGLTYEESITAPVRNRQCGRPATRAG
jgi:hypothetical protein